MVKGHRKDQTVDTASLSRLYAQYSNSLRNFFTRRVKSRDEAEDMTHDLLLKMAQRQGIEQMENPEGFLFTAASNALRDRARHDKIVEGYQTVGGLTGKTVEELSPERVLISKQTLERLLLALDKLDGRARDVFILHRLEGMKYADIARMYGLSVSSIEKDMIRAIAHLGDYAEL